MGCCHYPAVKEGCDSAFTVDTSRITFGPGCLSEVGDRARALGMKRVALFSDARVARLPHFEKVRQSLLAAGLDVVVFTDVHAPHGMAYAVAGRVRDFRPSGYPQDEPLVPHGLAVIVNAPAVFRYTASASPERHLEAAGFLGADVRGAGSGDAGEVLAGRVVQLMRAVGVPNGLPGVGYTVADVDALTEGAFPQQRLLQNAPREMTRPVLTQLFRQALRYW
ncbi:iron-containing alcohol dehydrogenase [Corallococcus exiguus]|uniref:iron-containing alcohol dehydrogenase n=1 Tax=Corallococcus TaxID=83461 RepID=UPI000EE9FC2C|nr:MULTISPECIES: iron-containing alcohol dehydrogenase [Corallococcus]NNB84090.1 iron-containing alcohol dehydrogenase [Corallococcus exiguus]NNB94479.1 iron-containing alcohol dehydrogenase [Corallococcus exiguus]NNC04430.1 iron-containing alcohol dehydrogenase [Corallococcus exiguus]NPC48829.1 iron-containing alcohol dehydrogenase [Corallococcus exiguus]RKH83569.1 iron-containing alcohol dehydrogenase [Corallococcus sp. AB032C]